MKNLTLVLLLCGLALPAAAQRIDSGKVQGGTFGFPSVPLADSVHLTDSASATNRKSVTDTFGTSEVLQAVRNPGVVSRFTSDSFGLTDKLQHMPTPQDALGLSAAVAEFSFHPRSPSGDSFGTSDSVSASRTAGGAYSFNISDTFQLSEVLGASRQGGAHRFSVSVQDPFHLDDPSFFTNTLLAGISDSLRTMEAMGRQPIHNALLNEGVNALDTLAENSTGQNKTLTVSDVFVLSEGAARVQFRFKGLSDAFTTSDSASIRKNGTNPESPSDSVGASDSLALRLNLSRGLSETFTAIDQVSTSVSINSNGFNIAASDTLELDENVTAVVRAYNQKKKALVID